MVRLGDVPKTSNPGAMRLHDRHGSSKLAHHRLSNQPSSSGKLSFRD